MHLLLIGPRQEVSAAVKHKPEIRYSVARGIRKDMGSQHDLSAAGRVRHELGGFQEGVVVGDSARDLVHPNCSRDAGVHSHPDAEAAEQIGLLMGVLALR